MQNNQDRNLRARINSIESLQNLYTIVIALSMAESIRRLLITGTNSEIMHSSVENWLTFICLIFTIIPFYHGASRYLHDTYATKTLQSKSYGLILDFSALFFEGLAFYFLALLSSNAQLFFSLLGFLFLFDAIWVGFTNLYSVNTINQTKSKNYYKWAFLNIIVFILLNLILWSNLFPDLLIRYLSITFLVILRTIADYGIVWNFYFPPTPNTDLLPSRRSDL